MAGIRGPLARLDRSREELAKAWLVRLIERASLDEIRDLPTERIAREVPELIGDLLSALDSDSDSGPPRLSREAAERAAELAELRSGREAAPAEVARDVAALQAVLVGALREDLADEPERFAGAVERLAGATGEIQAAAVEEIVRARSRELESQVHVDALTGLHNSRYLQAQIAHLVQVQKRYEHPFALMLLDVDGLRRVNESHGVQAGDRILIQVAVALRRSVRAVDTAARLGADEFCVLAPIQDTAGGAILAERLSAAVQEDVVAPDAPPVTVSIGVVSCPEHGDEAESLVAAADRAMFQAKASGERVAIGAPDDEPAAEEAPSR